MEFGGAPAVDPRAAVEEHLHQPEHAGVVHLDPGDPGASGGDWEGEALKQGELDVNIERGGLEGGEAVGHGGERLSDRVEVVE